MKIQLWIILFCWMSVEVLGQSVSIEPGKSVFNNSLIGTEIRSEHNKPLRISSESHLTPLEFYNYSQLDGRVRTSYGYMQLYGRNGVLLMPSMDSTIGAKFYLYPDGKLLLSNNGGSAAYRLTVFENNENVAFFGNSIPNGNTTVNFNNRGYLTAGVNDFKVVGNAGVNLESTTNGSFRFRSQNTDRFVVDGINGYVGVGITSPRKTLHVEGVSDTIALFKNVSNSFTVVGIHKQLTFWGGQSLIAPNTYEDFGTMHSTGLLSLQSKTQQSFFANGKYGMRIDENGNVTIRPVYSGTAYYDAKAELDVGGYIRSLALDFNESSATERRPVLANKDGVLVLGGPSTQYVSYNFSHVQAQDWNDELRKGSGYAWFNTNNAPKTLYLPVNLPDGVRITNIRVYVLDNSASDISFTFSRNAHTTNSFTTLGSATSSGNSALLRSINSAVNEVVSNLDYSYYVNISSVGNWTGNTVQFHSMVITYQH